MQLRLAGAHGDSQQVRDLLVTVAVHGLQHDDVA